jgi:hypothetical protein
VCSQAAALCVQSGCSLQHDKLQPYVSEVAALCVRRLQPYVSEAATVGVGGCGPYACIRCVDEMAAMLQRAGFRDVLVDWGGDVKVLGQHPERRGAWRAGVARPPSLEELFARFSAAGGGGGGGGGGGDAEIVSEIVTLKGGRCLAASGDFGAAPRKCGRRDVACTSGTRGGRRGACGCRVGACGGRVSAYMLHV